MFRTGGRPCGRVPGAGVGRDGHTDPMPVGEHRVTDCVMSTVAHVNRVGVVGRFVAAAQVIAPAVL